MTMTNVIIVKEKVIGQMNVEENQQDQEGVLKEDLLEEDVIEVLQEDQEKFKSNKGNLLFRKAMINILLIIKV